jgi:hypothetical protein
MTRSLSSALLALFLGAATVHAQQPWLTAETRVEHDSQVRTATRAAAEYGRYLRPDMTLALRLAGERIAADAAPSGRLNDVTGVAALAGTLAVPAARMGINLSGGALFGGPAPAGHGSSATLVYDAAAGINTGQGTTLRLRAARDRYTATAASIDTLLMGRTMELALDRSGAPGWAGELLARRAEFGDGNPVTTAYAWLLAPLSRSATHSLRAGYAVGWQDSDQSNWVPATAGSVGVPQEQVPGRYAPYYTPHDVLTHSALLNAALAVGGAWLLLDGAAGIRATETAPVLIRNAAEPQEAPALFFYDRSYTPYRGGLSLVLPVGGHTSITAAAAYSRTAYYRLGSLRLALARAL